MAKSKKRVLGLIILSSFFLCFAVNPNVKAQPIQLDSSTYFGFNNGWLNFSSTQTFNTVQEIGNYWYFDLLGISLDSANATALSWFTNNQVILNLTSISGAATVLMNLSALQTSPTVSGASAYNFNSTSGILNVTESSFTVQVVTISLSPIYITGFTVNSYTLAQNVPFYMNATVYDEWGIVSLTSFTLEFSSVYQIQVSWSMGAWTLPYGSANCMLIVAGCSVTQNDTYSDIFTFAFELLGSAAETSIPVLTSGTLAIDAYGNSASGSIVNLATYLGSGPGNMNPGPGGPIVFIPPGEEGLGPPFPGQNETQPPGNNPGNPNNTTGPFTPPNTPQIPEVTAELPFSPVYLLLGAIFIFAVVGVTGFYAGRKKKDPLSDAQNLWNRQLGEKNVKWNKDE